jgi:hypothetical protein
MLLNCLFFLIKLQKVTKKISKLCLHFMGRNYLCQPKINNMKRRFLHFSFLLIIIALGGMFIGFNPYNGVREYVPRQQKSKLQLPKIKPATEYLAKIRNNQHTGLIDPTDIKKAREQLNKMNYSRAMDLNWLNLGPDNFGGRTRAIISDNQDGAAKTVYAAGVSGGIWKSTNDGITWFKVNEDGSNLYVSCMTQAPDGTIYAGTGESFAAETMSGLDDMGYAGGFMGQGIYKSTDGNNFSLLTATEPEFNNTDSDWAYVNELAYDNTHNRLYAATNTGLKFSNDGGDTWAMAADTSGTELNMNAFDVQVSSEGVVLACVDNKCYLSLSGNVNDFVLRSTGDSVSLPENNVKRIEFAYAPSDPNIAYASVVNQLGKVYNIYRSDDKGNKWRVILPGAPEIPVFFGQGVYDNTLAVYPENPDKILLGGLVLYQGEKIQDEGLFDWRVVSEGMMNPNYASYVHFDIHTAVFRHGTTNEFYVGSDGGVSKGVSNGNEYSYTTSNRNYFTTQFYRMSYSGVENYNLGGAQDNGSILITGTGNTIKQGKDILGADGGACAVSLINNKIVVVSSTQGRMFRSEDAGDNYSTQFLTSSISNDQAFLTPIALWESFDNPNSRDSVYFYAHQEYPGGTTLQVRSKNSGQPFYYTLPDDITLHDGDSILVRDVVSSRLFIATANHIWMTKELHNFGKTPEWFEISGADVGMIGIPQCIAYSSDGNHLFVGTQNGKLYRISNLALAYNFERADISSPSCIVSTEEIPLFVPGSSDPIDQVITSLAVDPSDPANVLVTLGNYGNEHYVLFTENALDADPVFDTRQGNLPQMPVYSSVIEMSDGNIALIGTENGIFVTENIHAASPEWYPEAGAIGKVPVFELKQQVVGYPEDEVVLLNGNEVTIIPYAGATNYGIIYAATYGRGLMKCSHFRRPVGIDEINAGQHFSNESLIVYPNPVINRATVEIEVNLQGVADIMILDINGRVVSRQNENLMKGLNKLNFNVSHLAAGTYIMKISSGNQVFTGKFIVK